MVFFWGIAEEMTYMERPDLRSFGVQSNFQRCVSCKLINHKSWVSCYLVSICVWIFTRQRVVTTCSPKSVSHMTSANFLAPPPRLTKSPPKDVKMQFIYKSVITLNVKTFTYLRTFQSEPFFFSFPWNEGYALIVDLTMLEFFCCGFHSSTFTLHSFRFSFSRSLWSRRKNPAV